MPTAVLQRDPSDYVQYVASFRSDNVVAGLPGKTAGDVADLGIQLRGAVRLEQPVQRRVQQGFVLQRGKDGRARKAKLDLATYLQDGFAGIPAISAVTPVAVRRATGANDAATDDLTSSLKFDFLTLVGTQ